MGAGGQFHLCQVASSATFGNVPSTASIRLLFAKALTLHLHV